MKVPFNNREKANRKQAKQKKENKDDSYKAESVTVNESEDKNNE